MILDDIVLYLSNRVSLAVVLLQLEEVTLLILLLRLLFNKSPKLETPLAVMEKDLKR